MKEAWVTHPAGVLALLCGTAAFFFFLERRYPNKVLQYFPPLLWIYSTPVLLSNFGILPFKSPAYDLLKTYAIPLFLTWMLLDVDIGGAVRTAGRGIFVMLMGSLGVVVGGVVSFGIVHPFLSPEAWRGYGALAGSWIGGTGNMAAVAAALKTPGPEMGLAVISDNLVYIVWLPLLLLSKKFAPWFNRFTKVDPDRIQRLLHAAGTLKEKSKQVEMRHVVYLLFLGFCVLTVSQFLSGKLPPIEPILSASVWMILLVTTLGIGLSFTPVKNIPGSHSLAMALIYIFIASLGARSELAGLTHAPWFVAGAFIWIAIHGLFIVLGARLFKMDVHTAAIASAANIGAAASAPIVAAFHHKNLVPVSILMALVGYAIGNYLAIFMAQLCYQLFVL